MRSSGLSAALASASATAARDSSESATMYSSGLWAAPPRGPSPSTVSAIEAAKWLASLAPPRGIPITGRPSASPARSSSGAVAAVRLDGRRGVLIVLLRPRELESLAITD